MSKSYCNKTIINLIGASQKVVFIKYVRFNYSPCSFQFCINSLLYLQNNSCKRCEIRYWKDLVILRFRSTVLIIVSLKICLSGKCSKLMQNVSQTTESNKRRNTTRIIKSWQWNNRYSKLAISHNTGWDKKIKLGSF